MTHSIPYFLWSFSCTIEGVTDFSTRYQSLNAAQKQAVDQIDGPLLVVAGPGTGKTELLSMRAANILKKTDTLPENILCLTFTDSGANAMRARLADIIGPDAYRVSIQTFHSFGTEIINQNSEYFYQGAEFKPADELSSYELLSEIFNDLDYSNPLAGKLNNEYIHLSDSAKAISELKQAGLSPDELLHILDANDQVYDLIETNLSEIFAVRISTTMLTLLAPLAEKIASLPPADLPPAITPLSNILALSMAHAFDAAIETGKTTPITAWRNEWLEKDTRGLFVFKDRKRSRKLRALAHIYYTYLSRMEQAGLYDYDDMILNVIHGMETQPDLRFNLQEKYHYIMVDEFQDTNLAQLRILFDLTDNPAGDQPNIMAVGDDDQAIYSFQGADVNNIHRFRERYNNPPIVTLIDNYRSDAVILDAARSVIVQASGRLESTINGLSKQLTAHHSATKPVVMLHPATSPAEERAWTARDIATRIEAGAEPASIVVLARRHHELISLLPHLEKAGITANYERRDNVLELPAFRLVSLLASVVTAIQDAKHDQANALIPELLAHPAFGFEAEAIWRLSLRAYRTKSDWMEQMIASETFTTLAFWLLEQAKASTTTNLEVMLDQLIGVPKDKSAPETTPEFTSPINEYYFGEKARTTNPEEYLTYLDGLRTVRSKLREYRPHSELLLSDFVEFVTLHHDMNAPITSVRSRSETAANSINLMTVHKSKGLEFGTVYCIGAVDSAWGERVRSRSRLINYPANLTIAPAGSTYDERVRLFFVAMTRARNELILSYASHNTNGKDQLPAAYLSSLEQSAPAESVTSTQAEILADVETDWRGSVLELSQPTMQELLAPTLESYKLSVTHLNTFLDVSRGGPQHFLLNNLLHFPEAKSPSASYGTAIHRTLQRAHNHFTATGKKRPLEDILGDYTAELRDQHISTSDFDTFNRRGIDTLTAFLSSRYDTFHDKQKTELSFAGQGVVLGEARLTGSLDLVDIADGEIIVTDYKTGAPSRDWKGKTDYEKIKLHKYKQQLMFYQLLVENSRDYRKYSFGGGVLQFVEPDSHGEIHALEASFTDEELQRFRTLIAAVWQAIITLDLPDISEFEPSYKGMLAFEQDIIDKYYT